jgi:hypothetical protein
MKRLMKLLGIAPDEDMVLDMSAVARPLVRPIDAPVFDNPGLEERRLESLARLGPKYLCHPVNRVYPR